MPVVAQGAPATVSLVVRNGTGDPTDPTNLQLEIKDQGGDPVDGFPIFYPGDIVKDSIGNYHFVWNVDPDQTIQPYVAQWDAILLGAPTPAYETWEVVAAGSLTPAGLAFLINPDDYDAIRGVLGVTTLDVADTDIELTAFAPHAELLIKRRITNWLEQSADTESLLVLRLATIYKTACLMAESYVRGGTIGLVRPLSTGEGRDWAEAAEDFCGSYEYWLNIADASDATGEDTSTFIVDPVKVGGPTSARLARRRSRGGGLSADQWWAYHSFPPYWSR